MTNEDKLSITFKCGKCGTRVTWPDDAIDTTKLTCANCGDDLGTYGDLRDQGMGAAKAKITSIMKETFKRS